MTTGVGNGVAIPHCKSDMLSEFAIALGIHPGGIDFHALDEAPARIVFLLVGPSSQPRGHILLLSRISRIVSKAPVRDALLKSSSPQEIWALLEANETESLQVKS